MMKCGVISFYFCYTVYGMVEVRYGNWYCYNFIKTYFEYTHCFLKNVFWPLILMKLLIAKWESLQINKLMHKFFLYVFFYSIHVSGSHMPTIRRINPYPTAFPYGNGMVLHFYQQQESSTTKTVHKVINKRLKAYV